MEDIEFTSRKKRLGLAVFVLAFVSTPFVSKDFVMEMSDRLLHRLVESGVDVGYGWPLFCHVLYALLLALGWSVGATWAYEYIVKGKVFRS